MDIVYYVAASVDGYIATPDGGIEWLAKFDSSDEDYGYREFYRPVEAVLMGSRTYEQVLGFGEWPYAGKPCWVFSRRALPQAAPEVRITAAEPRAVVAELEGLRVERAWLVGGGALAGAFQAQGLVSEIILSVMPVVLGAGVPLFGAPAGFVELELLGTTSYGGGVVQLRYRARSGGGERFL